jgi:CheY-like chemotaxis protein
MDGVMLAREIRRRESSRRLPLVLLTSMGRPPDYSDGAEFALQLTKPVKAKALRDALCSVLDPATPPHRADRAVLASRENGLGRARDDAEAVRILLVEDNVVNQRVALRLLDRMGYRADLASNGLEAVEAVKRQEYDVVLMDVHMPEMDGYEATAEIRRMEGSTRHTEIVAMTANAMAGDREQCLKAGMDDYVAKPVRAEELRAVLERWAAPGMKAARERARGAGAAPADAVNLAVLDDLFGSEMAEDPGFVDKLVEVYVDEAEQRLEALSEAIERGDARALAEAAHSLRGSSLMMGLEKLGALSSELEQLGKGGSLEGADAVLARLEAEFEQRRAALGAMRQPRR